MSKEAMKLALEALESSQQYVEASANAKMKAGWGDQLDVADAAITALREALAEQAQQKPFGYIKPGEGDYEKVFSWNRNERNGYTQAVYTTPQPQPAQQEPVAKVCHDLDGHIGWNPNLRQLPDEGTALYAAPPAQRPHECSRSHPHENMDAMCELRTEIARLTNENARLKALHQDDEINTYRMTLLCIRDGLQQGMSKSIQKLQAREINDVLGLPSFASYRTSPPAQPAREWVDLTVIEQNELYRELGASRHQVRAIGAKLKEKNT